MSPLLLALAVASPAAVPPWDVWTDLAQLAVARPGHQVVLRSSHCQSGCRYDRTDVDDPRFLRTEGDEQVVLEEAGAGAIARVWMTSALGTTLALDPNVRLRVRLDGGDRPVVDLPLVSLFAGRTLPFVPPLVSDEQRSSGGFVSYVPIPYRRGCKVSLVGAIERPLWFQFTLHRLRDADGVKTFRGDEDLSGLARLLERAGPDPWDEAAGTLEQRRLTLDPGQDEVLRHYDGPGTLTALRLRAAPAEWATLRLRLFFDGQIRADLPLEDFFGASPAPGVRSTLVGVDDGGLLYSWFPMPFAASATVRLYNAGPASVPVWYETRRRVGAPAPGSLPFSVQARREDASAIGTDLRLALARGQGRWVGLFLDLQSVGFDGGEYLEGDERVYLDGSPHPAHYGTGVEDLIGGGFYFARGPFALPTHGAPLVRAPAGNGEDRTSMYRLFLTDAVPFATVLRAGLEGGPTGNLAVRARRVAWIYRSDPPGLSLRGVLDVGDAASRADAQYQTGGDETCSPREGGFEGEPEQTLSYVACERSGGPSSFVFHVPPGTTGLRLRRRLEATLGEQAATVQVNGRVAGAFAAVEPNAFRSLREIDLDLPEQAGASTLLITVVPEPGPFTEIRWELWSTPGRTSLSPERP
jgi:hypothetical protein